MSKRDLQDPYIESTRVVHVVESWLPVTSGYATRSHALITAQARGASVVPSVLVSSRQDVYGEEEAQAPVPLRGRLRLVEASRREWAGRRLRRFYVDGTHLEAEVHAFCREVGADLVHAHWSSGIGHAALRAARTLGVPFVAEVRFDLAGAVMTETVRFPCTPLERLARRWFERHLWSANGIVAASYSLAAFVRGYLPAAPCRVTVVPNGIEEEEADASALALRQKTGLEQAIVVGSTSKMLRYEGLDVLLSALRRLRAEGHTDVHVLLVGDGPQRVQLQQRAEEEDLPVTFVGRVPRSEVPAYLRSMDLFAVPRRAASVTRHASPVKVSEAMAAGVPVIGSRLGDLPWMLAEDRGVLVAPGSVAELAQALSRLAADADRRHALGQRARRWAQAQPSWAEAASRYDNVYAHAFQHFQAHGN